MKIYINNGLVDEKDAKVSVFDHGLLYGDGIFEGIRMYNKCIFKLDEHLERLEYSAKGIDLQMPWSRQEIADATVATCRANNLQDAYIRLVVTRGVGNLGISPKGCNSPQLIIIANKIAVFPLEEYEKGVGLFTVATRRVSQDMLSTSVKSLNYLNNVLAKIEAMRAGFADALMLNEQGYVAESSASNIFIVHKGRLLTPYTSDGALPGITRAVVMEIARNLQINVQETHLTRYDVWNADECFLTGTGVEIMPVVELDGRTIGLGKRGPINYQLTNLFRERTIKEGVFI